ncbi:MAG: hemerythrin [Comamonadaceae bacterium CG1_02_60_18]|nr:MAG: hemerythrin [Comamonadaceae bacterium CG1_02_60_18]PIQ55600.1 MAG: hemerythrin [Comamonadaceae bacterium CG12_big_fil_rev_8_21_14_0_65_59_15]
MADAATKNQFSALDLCHQHIQQYLAELGTLLVQLRAGEDSPHLRQRAGIIEAFFSDTARRHHVEEEHKVFPAVLASDNAELVRAVSTLQQDHLWIELNWSEIAPMLRALAQGEDWVDPAELQHAIDVFVALCSDHIALEEALIYPEAKQRFAQELAGRARRLSA